MTIEQLREEYREECNRRSVLAGTCWTSDGEHEIGPCRILETGECPRPSAPSAHDTELLKAVREWWDVSRHDPEKPRSSDKEYESAWIEYDAIMISDAARRAGGA